MVGANGERVDPSVRCPFVVCDVFLVREAFHAMTLSFFLCHVMSSRLDQGPKELLGSRETHASKRKSGLISPLNFSRMNYELRWTDD
ncbi:hypothetical protein BHM03_00055007 [Ensete ventricosum]|nr:hypothetical protein BHM03_00055007 [Ensete ventricosum]